MDNPTREKLKVVLDDLDGYISIKKSVEAAYFEAKEDAQALYDDGDIAQYVDQLQLATELNSLRHALKSVGSHARAIKAATKDLSNY